MKLRVCSGLALILTHLLCSGTEAQSIRGKVTDDSTSRPIAGAEVILRDSAGQMVGVEVTDRSGYFEMAVAAGVYSFQVLRMGFEPTYTSEFRLAEGMPAMDVTITLPHVPILLDPAVVEGDRQPFAPGPLEGFYARKRRGWGIQLDREAIEAKVPVQVTDIFRNLPGVRVVGLGRNRYTIEMVGQPPRIPSRSINPEGRTGDALAPVRGCPISYWVDGIPYRPDERGINEFLVSGIEAVEVYRRASETPAEFLDSRSRCGVIVIWTKRGPDSN